jgi:DNA repair protein RecN (Recombination protein N)
MLERLVIHDVVLIDKLALQLGPGLNVFTGETGAGKSILLDALGLALGERSEAGLVRNGATQASVTAEFHLPKRHSVFALAEEQGLTAENPLILRRVISKDGKSRAFLNDQAISIGLLKQFGEQLL